MPHGIINIYFSLYMLEINYTRAQLKGNEAYDPLGTSDNSVLWNRTKF